MHGNLSNSCSLPESDPRFKTGNKLYWFSSKQDVAQTHADYWPDDAGKKWRLTLKCKIPVTSQRWDVHNFHSVESVSIRILEQIWW